jgi:transcriptional regulator with XRE-family HTH domain
MTTRDRDQWAREIGARVREARKANKLSEEKLAGRADISRMTVRRIESGKTLPSLETIEAIAAVMGVRAVDLLGWATGLYLNAA